MYYIFYSLFFFKKTPFHLISFFLFSAVPIGYFDLDGFVFSSRRLPRAAVITRNMHFDSPNITRGDYKYYKIIFNNVT